MTAKSDDAPRPGGRGKRRRRGRDDKRRDPRQRPAEGVAQVIVTARPAVDASQPADVPLTAEEAAQMREHFRFLKTYRKQLQLRLNAAEDLLINGAREVTHRGVCQHLLDKVSRARVETVAKSMDPATRSRFLAGAVRLSPDVPYLLLYLESVKESASQAEATAALWQALERIDFTEVSAAQMRRVLELIADLFDTRDRPQLLFGLLQSKSFRETFDRSAEAFPESVAESFLPLRAVHAVVVAGQANPHGVDALRRGVEMLLSAREHAARGYRPATRRRLFDLGIALGVGQARAFGPGLRALLDAFEAGSREQADAAFALAGLFLSSGDEPAATKVLERLRREHPGFRAPQLWLDALAGPRVGPFGITEVASEGKRKGRSRFSAALDLRDQQSVWLCVGTSEEAETFVNATELGSRLLIPGVLPILSSGVSTSGAPYFAVSRLGGGLHAALSRDAGLDDRAALSFGYEAVTLLGALAHAGVALPDVRFDRFLIDAGGRLWLRDLLFCAELEPAAALEAHLRLAKELLDDVARRVRGSAVLERLRVELDAAPDLRATAKVLAPWCGATRPPRTRS